MKRILAAAGVALAFGVTLSAQSTYPAPSQPQTDQPAKKSQSKMSSASSVTLTGCLREGDTPNTYVLSNVDSSELRSRTGTQSGGSSGAGSGSATSSGSSASSSSAGTSGTGDETVELVGGKNLDLKAHVGHRVQITGTMAAHGKDKSKTTGTTGSATGEAQTDTTSRSGRSGEDDKSKHRVNVRAMKHISETCSM